eukprot:SAG11_NODE_6200_length_1366_cov_1.017364_1_plen_49_part_00
MKASYIGTKFSTNSSIHMYSDIQLYYKKNQQKYLVPKKKFTSVPNSSW